MITDDFKYIFIDESGNFGYDFNSSGTSSHYIITAVVINKENIVEIEDKVKEISKNYFGGKEIKSSSIGSDFAKRIRILNEIKDLDFDIVSYVIDKKEINLNKTPGMNFKESFLKSTHYNLHKELTAMYPSLKVVSDNHGSKEFMESFKDYFQKKELYLVSKYDFEFGDSKEYPLIQLAELICGTISYKYENKAHSDKYRVFLNYLGNRIIRLEEWPLDYKKYLLNTDFLKKGEYDSKIATHCIELASKYIEKNEINIDEIEKDKVITVKYLLYKLRYENPNNYYNAKQLREHINRVSGRFYSNHQFKSTIIAKLRDSGVILSSSNKGYKIPISEVELYSYTNQTMQVIYPMLERLRKCRKDIKTLTSNELDIMDQEEYADIKAYFDFILKDNI